MATGGCFCEKVKYTLKNGVPKESTIACLCADCQKLHGTAYSLDVTVPEEEFKITEGEGELRELQHKSDSQNKLKRYFCGSCGSHIYAKSDGKKGKVVLKGGTLDEIDKAVPQKYIYTKSKPSWFQIPSGVDSCPEMPDE